MRHPRLWLLLCTVWLVALPLGTGCSKKDPATDVSGAARKSPPDRCAQAVDHLLTVVNRSAVMRAGAGAKAGAGATPSRVELAVQAKIRQTALGRCRAKGITEAQLRCILAARSAKELAGLADCPALERSPLPWLRLTHGPAAPAPRSHARSR